jgi:hypothetical protein
MLSRPFFWAPPIRSQNQRILALRAYLVGCLAHGNDRFALFAAIDNVLLIPFGLHGEPTDWARSRQIGLWRLVHDN